MLTESVSLYHTLTSSLLDPEIDIPEWEEARHAGLTGLLTVSRSWWSRYVGIASKWVGGADNIRVTVRVPGSENVPLHV